MMKEDHTLNLKVLGEVKANMISKTTTSIVDIALSPFGSLELILITEGGEAGIVSFGTDYAMSM